MVFFQIEKNLLKPKFIKMFFEIISFYNNCEKLNIDVNDRRTLGEYLKKSKNV